MPGSKEPRSRNAANTRLEGAAFRDATSFLLARANAISVTRGNAALAPFGLRVRSYAVLELAATDARPTQRELASFLRLDPSQVVSLVDDLESQGLVARTTDPDDRRTKVVEATALGRERVAEAREAIGAADERVFASLSAQEREALTALLQRVAFDD